MWNLSKAVITNLLVSLIKDYEEIQGSYKNNKLNALSDHFNLIIDGYEKIPSVRLAMMISEYIG